MVTRPEAAPNERLRTNPSRAANNSLLARRRADKNALPPAPDPSRMRRPARPLIPRCASPHMERSLLRRSAAQENRCPGARCENTAPCPTSAAGNSPAVSGRISRPFSASLSSHASADMAREVEADESDQGRKAFERAFKRVSRASVQERTTLPHDRSYKSDRVKSK